MNTKTLLWVVVAAAGLVAIAWFAASRRTPATVEEGPAVRSPWLPELRERLQKEPGAIDRIEIERGDRRTVMSRTAEGWVLPDKASYPADPQRVDAILRSLGALEVDQALTTDPARFGELGLAWPDSRNEATLVRVLAGATPVSEVIVGRTKFSPPSVYVRRADSKETWRCVGEFAAEADPARLMKPVVAEIPAPALASIEWGSVVVRRNEAGSWIVDGIVEDDSPDAPDAPDAPDGPNAPEAKKGELARVLPELFTRLEMDDVRPSTSAPAAETVKAVVGDRTVLFELLAAEPADSEIGQPSSSSSRSAQSPSTQPPRWYRLVVGEPEPGLAAVALPEETARKLDEIRTRVANREFRMPAWKAGRLVTLLDEPAKTE